MMVNPWILFDEFESAARSVYNARMDNYSVALTGVAVERASERLEAYLAIDDIEAWEAKMIKRMTEAGEQEKGEVAVALLEKIMLWVQEWRGATRMLLWLKVPKGKTKPKALSAYLQHGIKPEDVSTGSSSGPPFPFFVVYRSDKYKRAADPSSLPVWVRIKSQVVPLEGFGTQIGRTKEPMIPPLRIGSIEVE